MKNQLFQSMLSAVFTAFLFFASLGAAKAAPGNLGHIPLFVAPPTQPNIFFMLDDSGSMGWNLRTTGGGSISFSSYDITPVSNEEWRTWCLGANALAYNSAITYKPWTGNMPGVTPLAPFPNQTNLASVWSEPMTLGVGSIGGASWVRNRDTGAVDLSNAPVVQWTDDDSDGNYDNLECANSFADPRGRVVRANTLSPADQINFANWFTYYRDRDRTVSAAVTQVISNSTARIGMATLHNNRMIGSINVGKKVEDMTDPIKKDALLYDVANIRPSGGTPLRTRLNWVGQYFDKATATAPSGLNIGTAPSPILSVANGGECQQNFVMLMSDGSRNGGSPGVGHQDQDTSNPYVYNAHKDDRSNDLADVAMKWYKTDLASTYANKVVVQTGATSQNLDDNNQQHLVTFTVAFGLSDSLTNPADRTQIHNWPAGSLADMRHAAYNGRGEYLSAGNADTLISSLQTVISNIESRQGSAAAVSFSSTSLVSGTSLFFASFDTVGWKGDLRSLSIDPVTGDLGVLPLWNAASLLDSKTNADIANRAIYTWGLDAAAANNGVLFNWGVANPQPASVISNDFKKNQDSSTESTVGFPKSQVRMNFVRGNTSAEGTGLIRDRDSRLGDIINSPPHSVVSPISNWPNTGSPFSTYSTLYSDYQAAQLLRQGMVYVGANDGMLHGFNSSTGEEVFAYIPSSPASANDNDGLHYLTESDYQHKYYVDGSPISADVFLRTEPSTAQDWKTILVGSLRGGGRGIYALDVTDPTAFSNTQAAAKNVVMWEFTDQDDSDLGFTFSEPQITMMNNGEWAVIVGNGYNATGTDTAKLMILFVERGIDGQWTAGDYIKLDTGVGINGNKNGLSTPTLIDLNSDGKTDRIYAGDLYGNMWAFDVTDALETNWQIAHQDALANKVPLFTATHHAGSPATQVLAIPTPQPITMKPLVVKPSWVADTGSNTPNVMVYFGTGQYIATGDATNADQQTFYGVWDAGIIPTSGSASSVSPTKLVEQTFLPGFPISARVLSHHSVNYSVTPSSGDLGWFINLPETGERVVVDAFQLQGLVFFNTLTPSSAPCSAGGASWLMAVNEESGANPAFAAFDLTGDRVLDSADQVSDGSTPAYAAGVVFGHGIASASAIITNDAGASFAYISGTDSDTPHRYDLPSGGAGGPPVSGARKSWLQLFN